MEWRKVIDFENIYEVSSEGEVRTDENKTTFTEKHGIRKWKQRSLKQKTDKKGYKRVALWKDGKVKTQLVHRLVATAFIQKEENKNIVNHKDGNPSNNKVGNLEWIDSKGNVNHAFENGLMKTNKITKLIRKSNKETLTFNSMSKADAFLGRCNGYISNLLKRGKKETADFYIELEEYK